MSYLPATKGANLLGLDGGGDDGGGSNSGVESAAADGNDGSDGLAEHCLCFLLTVEVVGIRDGGEMCWMSKRLGGGVRVLRSVQGALKTPGAVIGCAFVSTSEPGSRCAASDFRNKLPRIQELPAPYRKSMAPR